jgi:hypothetical protein
MSVKKQILKVRNPFYSHPLMRKSGAHEKSNKAKRKGEKQKLKKEWGSLIVFIRVLLNNAIYTGLLFKWRAYA